jgi:DNA sulfur modification protein DndD
MRISSLKMTNFRPFNGEHEIDLSPAEGNSLVLIHGENQSGKTAFFLALYWCLYGQVKSRTGLPLPIFRRGEKENDYLINSKAIEDGINHMQVDLIFEHEGTKWHLTRTATCSGDPFEGHEFQADPLLQVGEEPIDTSEIQRRVNDVLHEDAAQFYFFDGEMLSQYEKWLADPTEAQTRVKEAVERTVGISAFRLGRHLESVHGDFQKELIAADRKEKRNEQTIGERDRLVRRKNEVQGQIEDFEAEIRRMKGEVQSIQQAHGDLADWTAARTQIGLIEKSIDAEKDKQEAAISEIQGLVREKFWLPLNQKAEDTGRTLLAQVQEAVHSTVHLALQSVQTDECVLCLRDLDEPSREHLAGVSGSGKGNRLHGVLEIQDALLRMDQTRRFLDPSAIEHLETLEGQLTGARIEVDRLDGAARRLRAAHPVKGDSEKEMEALINLNRRIGNLESDVVDANAEVSGYDTDIKSLDVKIGKSGTRDPALARRARASALAVSAFGHALEAFSALSREKVQTGATAAFKALVQNEGYDGIDIDEQYVVRPVDRAGNVQTAPSSGGQQLLTLSLIAGLNGAAVHDAPIVMDTPFGRLDVGNRKRILHWVRALVRDQQQQVILMVHSGELTREELQKWKIVPGRSYSIVADEVHAHHVVETGALP